MTSCQIIILAAGSGKRMSSALPKVMHEIFGKPMIEHVVNNALGISKDIVIVTSELLKSYIAHYQNHGIKLIIQKDPRGTADAVFCALESISSTKPIVILYADNPLISADIILDLLSFLKNNHLKIATIAFNMEAPNEYGRIIVDQNGGFSKIIEAKDASDMEKAVTLCNSGIMVFAEGIIQKYMSIYMSIPRASGGEFYLTDLIELASGNKERVSYMLCRDRNKVIGINTKEELELANKAI
jgi:UDP-N-acetylglucosamine pyrophosphorylase